MKTADIVSITLSIFSAISFGTMFIIILVRALKPRKPLTQSTKESHKRFILEQIG